MKRLKDLLLSISILSSIIIVLLIIISLLNVKTTIELPLNENTESRYEKLKEEINGLENGECKDFLNKYTAYLDKGKFDGIVKLNDIYDYMWNFNIMEYYSGAKEYCGITDTELANHNVANKYVSNMVLPDALLYKYTFAYELKITDELRKSAEPNIDVIAFQSYRSNQVEILSNYLDIIDMEDSNE